MLSLKVHTDQGRNFESKLVKNCPTCYVFEKPGPHHYTYNRMVRYKDIKTILEYLSKYISDNQKDWDRLISLYIFSLQIISTLNN